MAGASISDRKAIQQWNSWSQEFDTPLDEFVKETPVQKRKRISKLEGDFTEWAMYYFPKVCKAPFAPWHKRYIKWCLNSGSGLNFAAIEVSRDMAKSSVSQMLVMYLYYTGKVKQVGFFSNVAWKAEGLLAPIKLTLEKNAKLKRDYGDRRNYGTWTPERFSTTDGTTFLAFGAGQNPRGEKDENSNRFDLLLFDDFDDPEVCLNPERLDKNWKYVEGDCIPALHVSGRKWVIFLNNKIAEDCIIDRATKKAKALKGTSHTLIMRINLTDKQRHSMWPEAYTDEECKEMIIAAGAEAETEYFNNPILKGTTFKKEWFQFKKLPPLSRYKYLMAYLDGGFTKSKTSDNKALVLVGLMNGEYHIRKAYVDNVSINQMIGWHYDLQTYLDSKNATCQFMMEEVFLLGMLHDHFDRVVKDGLYQHRIPMLGDKRKKPDKDLRIANTAGYFERGKVFIDISQQDDRHMRELIDEFLKFQVGNRKAKKDGPDAIEGAFHLLRMQVSNDIDGLDLVPARRNKFKI